MISPSYHTRHPTPSPSLPRPYVIAVSFCLQGCNGSCFWPWLMPRHLQCRQCQQEWHQWKWHRLWPTCPVTPMPAALKSKEWMLSVLIRSTTDVITVIIQFIYCRNSSWDWLKLVFKGKPNQIGLVLFGSVAVLQVWAMVWTGCSPQLPPLGSKNQTWPNF